MHGVHQPRCSAATAQGRPNGNVWSWTTSNASIRPYASSTCGSPNSGRSTWQIVPSGWAWHACRRARVSLTPAEVLGFVDDDVAIRL